MGHTWDVSQAKLNAVRETLTDRELMILDRHLFPRSGRALTVEEIAKIRGIKVHSAEKLVSIVRGKLRAAGIRAEAPGKPRSTMPLTGRTQTGDLRRLHVSLESETAAELELVAAKLGTSMGAIANDAILATLDRYRELAGSRG